MDRLALGTQYERKAESFLNKKGLKTIARNFRCRLGEIDLIMQDKDCLVFAEIRYRQNTGFGGGAASVTRTKQQRIICTAQRYLQQNAHRAMNPCRFDVISMSHSHGRLTLDWIRNAFSS
jgi:putative endonuclease